MISDGCTSFLETLRHSTGAANGTSFVFVDCYRDENRANVAGYKLYYGKSSLAATAHGDTRCVVAQSAAPENDHPARAIPCACVGGAARLDRVVSEYVNTLPAA